MRIAVLAHGLRAGGGRVVGTNILDNLTAFAGSHEFLFVVPDQAEYRALGLEKRGIFVSYYRRKLGHLDRWYFDSRTLPNKIRQFRPNVVLGLGNLGVRSIQCPQAILVHNPYLFYDKKSYGNLSLMSKMFVFSLKREFDKHLRAADLVFTQTQTIEKRLRGIWGYQGKTVITPNVISDFLDFDPARAAMPSLLEGHTDKFKMFYLTRYYPHKGLEMLVEVVDRFQDELADVVTVLTIDPDQHPNARRLLQFIKNKGLCDRIINVGPLRPDQLSDYYLSCDCLVMPTRLESFSGTYLESMHFGLPILTSDLDFAHEVCDEAALYFDPWDPASIKDAILRLKNDPGLKGDLVRNGTEHLAGYFGKTWDDIAATMINELRQLVDVNKGLS